MPRSIEQLRDTAVAIWRAGVDAVLPERLVSEHLGIEGDVLRLDHLRLPLPGIRRIAVVGAGKAGAGMVCAVEAALGPSVLAGNHVAGLVNVPADCVAPTDAIELVAARPGGVNEPTIQGVAATRRILDLVGALGEPDLCLCLVSSGGTALFSNLALERP